ncbi:MAG: hypothetical protein EOO10_20160 [Chitinophagaceae bacterium]|nr:MAG: hypothetical protein EOO10_20160 [Chitinophagaceae bacterium]
MKTDQQFISLGAMVAFSGFVLSGRVSFLFVQWLHPSRPGVLWTFLYVTINPFKTFPIFLDLSWLAAGLMLPM